MNKVEQTMAEAESFRRGLLLSTNERRVAKARAEMLRARAQMEAAKAEAELARHEAQQLREHIIATSTKSIKIPFRTIAAGCTIVLLIAAVSKITYVGFTSQPKLIQISHAVSHPVVEAPPRHILTHKAYSAGDIQFKKAMDRLQGALESLPDGEAEIVRQVNQRYTLGSKPCPLEWVNGEAALSLEGSQNRVAPSLTTAVIQCASAIEKYRDQRDAAVLGAGSSVH